MAALDTMMSTQQHAFPCLCSVCGGTQGDFRQERCGCAFHARCAPYVPGAGSSTKCPVCRKECSKVHILPISLEDVDEKLKMSTNNDSILNASAGNKRSSDGCDHAPKAMPFMPIEISSLLANERTGRWTSDEVSYVDALISAFDSGVLLINDGARLHDFLTGMLNCKLSRLTKKFKSANFTRGYTRHEGGATGKNGLHVRRVLTNAYEKFVTSHFNSLAQAELRITTASEWRKYLVDYCKLCLDKPAENILHIDAYLTSMEALESRIQVLQEQRRKRRKLDITSGRSRPNILAARHVQQPPPVQPFQPVQPYVAGGVGAGSPKLESSRVASDDYSSSTAPEFSTTFEDEGDDDKTTDDDFLSLWGDAKEEEALVTDDEKTGSSVAVSVSNSLYKSGNTFRKSPISSNSQQQQAGTYQTEVGIIASLAHHVSQNQQLPFEYYDLWRPAIDAATGEAKLVFVGSHFANDQSPPTQLVRFASFSSTFDFKVGVGMPGRVFASQQPCWEQQVQYAQSEHFKRAEGAAFSGIQTAVGIPMVCSRTGNMLVIGCYSRHNIQRNDELVYKLWADFSRLSTAAMTASASDAYSPQCFQPPPTISQVKMIKAQTMHSGGVRSSCITRDELITLLAEQVPIAAPSSSADTVNLVNGFMHLRMLLLRAPKYPPNSADGEMVRLICNSYSLYNATGQQSRKDLASVVVREYMFLMSGRFSLSPSMAAPQSRPGASLAPAKRMLPMKATIICLGRNHSKSTSTVGGSISSPQ